MNVLIDTNVLLSAALRDKLPERVMLYVATPEIVQEYVEVLRRPKFKLSPETLQRWTELVDMRTINVGSPPAMPDFPRDPKDAPFLAAALLTEADYLITGDKDLLEAKDTVATRIVTAAEFADREVEHRELRSCTPAPVGRDARVIGIAVRQRENRAEHVLHDRGRAVIADIAHGDAALARRGEVDIVGAGRGERDQAQGRRRLDQLARDARLVDQQDGHAGDAPCHGVGGRGVVKRQVRAGVPEARGIEIVRGDGGVVEEHGTQGILRADRSVPCYLR